MPFYEVIFENGEHSIIEGDDDSVLSGVKEQHRRATAGEVGGPAGVQAVRVKRVLKYDEHPGSLYESQAVPAKDVEKWFADAVKKNQMGDLVSVPQLVAALRDGVGSLVVSGPHDTNYKMKEAAELDAKDWEAA